jgi:hypothetical protein
MLHNLSSLADSKALKDTISWCLRQSFSSTSQETPEMLHRRQLTEEAGKLLQHARLGRDAPNSPAWRKAMEMLTESDSASLAPLEYQLRSPQLKPPRLLGEEITDIERQHSVAEVILKRATLLACSGNFGPEPTIHEQEGRLLLYYPAENVSDGASRYASKGFYDPSDAPPWDLWVSYDRGELISWVPDALISLAQEGIDANPVDCIHWADSAFTLKPF